MNVQTLPVPYPQACATLEEACADAPRAFAATLRFALSRLGNDSRPSMFCTLQRHQYEHGRLFGRGVEAGGSLLVVEPRKPIEVLWAAEQALRSGAVAGVVAVVDQVTLTQTRRLDLAAREGGASALLLHIREGGLSAARRRWRVGSLPSAPNPFDQRAPGAFRIRAELVRSRAEPLSMWMLEQDGETHRFRLADRLADRGLVENGRPAEAA
ncbi:MAG TPA: hypothetical protein VHL31_18490 [Geminicoccus sp.]|uniref:hypothetical protein n=1 Tax=Geminicoccus sp. TaxID=2024832 RepID=UPI002E32C0C8|nr:hypothetical protein [Geminicoccus sp.]HEX2528277.1 hypothetical protein [Geminicoccus sp.]